NGDQILVGNAFRPHELGVKALLSGLTQQQAQLCMIATEIDQVGVQRFEFGDNSRIIALTHVDTFVERGVKTSLFQTVAYLICHTCAIGLLVVQNGNGFGLERIGNVLGSKRTLLIVATNSTE